MASKMRVLVICPWTAPEKLVEFLREKGVVIEAAGGHISKKRRDAGENIDIEKYKDVTHLLTSGLLPPSRADAPALRYIHSTLAGIDEIVDSAFFKQAHQSIRITNSGGIHSTQIAEWVTMTLFSFNHLFPTFIDQHRNRLWHRDLDLVLSRTVDVPGQKMGIVGYGSIGRQIGRLAQAAGMDVVVYTSSARPSAESRREEPEKVFRVAGTGDPDGTIPSSWFDGRTNSDLARFLTQGGNGAPLDVLVLSVPLTDSTRQMIGADQLAALTPGKTFFVNISRGAVVDQDELEKALRSGQLRGAAIDVADPEPLPADHPLWTAPNCMITPHISGASIHYGARTFDIFEQNIRREIEALGSDHTAVFINEVDVRKGY